MFIVYKKSSGGIRRDLVSFETEEEAVEFCTSHNWEWCDEETRFVWGLDYRELPKGMFVAYRILADGTRYDERVFENEIDAADFCEIHDMDYRRVWS